VLIDEIEQKSGDMIRNIVVNNRYTISKKGYGYQ